MRERKVFLERENEGFLKGSKRIFLFHFFYFILFSLGVLSLGLAAEV